MIRHFEYPAPWHRPLRCSTNPRFNYDCFGLRWLVGRPGPIDHNGNDFYNPSLRWGDPVYAVQAGETHESGHLGTSAGDGVSIFHPRTWRDINRWYSRYLHMDRDRIRVKKGDWVERGEVIGYVGSPAQQPVKAAHLHFELRRLTSWNPHIPGRLQGTPVDPQAWLYEPEGDGMYAYLTLEILQATLDAGVWQGDRTPETRAGVTFSRGVWYWGEQAERARRGLPHESLDVLDSQISAALNMNLV